MVECLFLPFVEERTSHCLCCFSLRIYCILFTDSLVTLASSIYVLAVAMGAFGVSVLS